MSIDTSYRLHVTSGDIDRRVTLPELPGAGQHVPSMIDRMGEQLQGALPLVAAGGIAGGVIGTRLLRLGGGGIFRGLVGGIAGVLGGAGLAMAGLALARGSGHHAAPDAPARAQAPSSDVVARERVKVMTFNVHGGMGGPGKFGSSAEELDRLADVIRREQPDIVLLQEVDRFAARSNWTDTLAELDDRLDPDSAVGAPAATSLFGRDQHTAVMTFNGFEITDARNIVHQDPRGGGVGLRLGATVNLVKGAADHVLGTRWKASSDSKYQVRNTIEAMVRTPGGSDVRVLSGHYEWPNERFDHQELQVGSLARSLATWRGPTVWGGDFNIHDGTRDGADERRMLGDAGLQDALDSVDAAHRVSMTDRLDDPVAATRGGIDRIYVSDHARVTGARVVREAGTASDHVPVVAELELAPNAAEPPTGR